VIDRAATQRQTLSVVDCDIHPAMRSPRELDEFLPARWREHLKVFGEHQRQGMANGLMHPRMSLGAARADAFPPGGGFAGSDLDFMRAQHLDPNGVEYGVLMAMRPNGADERNLELGAALCRAANDWQIEMWVKKEPRLRAAISVTPEDADAAVAEIERCAAIPGFVQISIPPRTGEPQGRKRYWPIYAAAERAGMPIGMHVGGLGGHPSTGPGWPTYYMQEHHANMPGMQDIIISMVIEGVFERFPRLKVVLIEGGFTYVPALGWRLDKIWRKMRAEVPHLKRPPSEYIREHFYFTTQPIEEPTTPRHLGEIIDWIGWNRILFSTDYPHWDFDDPRFAFKIRLNEEQKAMIFRDNAKSLYGLQ
jgi:predicted TIM-barrel fold metal-dependent hydrolase